MEQDILQKFEELDKKLDAIYKSVEKTRKYFLFTLVVSVVFIVLPLVGLIFVIPMLLSTLTAGF